jgi:bifunctional non-homologous end joining protein LigD
VSNSRIFLLSPANCSGIRAKMILSPNAQFPLALQMRSPAGASLGEVFSFVSGLYFRGKLAYARRFARPPDPADPVAGGGVLVITANAGLRAADTPVTLESFAAFATAPIDAANKGYRHPIEQAARTIREAIGDECEVVLLGSIASGKYVEVLLPIFGSRLVFPPAFVGRGDMSRGGLMLRCVASETELDYASVAGAVRHGSRPPRLEPRRPRRPRSHEGHEGREDQEGSSSSSMPRDSHVRIPVDVDNATLSVDGREVRLTNLRKPFWPDRGISKGALIQYYADVAAVLLPHIRDRAMVMKRYPHGAGGPFFFMKRAPTPRPRWIRTCSIDHGSENVIDFPVIDDVPSLLWVINLGCIDLNQWYARCDDVDRPDYLHFDLDPGQGATFDRVRETALIVGEALTSLGMKPLVKTSGSRGLHIYVPIVRGPVQKAVWTFAKALAVELASRHGALMTSEYRVAKRPRGRVLVDYNQNAWGRTLASIYSVRPTPLATVSTPLTWREIADGARIEDFRIDNVRTRIREAGDVWKPLLAARGRTDLAKFGA